MPGCIGITFVEHEAGDESAHLSGIIPVGQCSQDRICVFVAAAGRCGNLLPGTAFGSDGEQQWIGTAAGSGEIKCCQEVIALNAILHFFADDFPFGNVENV